MKTKVQGKVFGNQSNSLPGHLVIKVIYIWKVEVNFCVCDEVYVQSELNG